MTVHIYHPDTHEFGLFDECPRCQEHAEHPLASLDKDNLARLGRGELLTALDRKAWEALGEVEQLQKRFIEATRDAGDEWAAP